MSQYMIRNPEWLIKLSSTSMNISTALLKLISYTKELSDEVKKDEEFYHKMKTAFQESAEIDLHYAEVFAQVSNEADCLVKEDGDRDG